MPQHASRRICAEQGIHELASAQTALPERRRRSRIQCEGVGCTIGQVIGLSGTGLRISARGRCRLAKDDRISMTLTYLGGQMAVVAKVAWVNKTGFFRYEAGMAFEGLTPEQNATLTRIAQTAMPKTLMRQGMVTDVPSV